VHAAGAAEVDLALLLDDGAPAQRLEVGGAAGDGERVAEQLEVGPPERPRLSSISSHTRFGDSGSTRGSTPSDDNAFATALPITPPTGMMPPSPAPLAPSGLCGAGLSSSANARIEGKSPASGSR